MICSLEAAGWRALAEPSMPLTTASWSVDSYRQHLFCSCLWRLFSSLRVSIEPSTASYDT